MAIRDLFHTGETQPEPKEGELDRNREAKDAQEGRPYLKRISPGAVSKYVEKRWSRLDTRWKKILTELKVNFLRYKGEQFVQVHPRDPNRVWSPSGAKKNRPPTINRIRRTVHRYQSQVTADEPVMEGVPVDHTDDARDAAEAATHILRGEWDRMNLHRLLVDTAMDFSIFRSAFWFFEWHKNDRRVPARKFFRDEAGQRYLAPVDGSGQEVDDPEDAATIWQGNTKVKKLLPMNVRWDNADYAHNADEVMVSEIITLGKLYEMAPKTRKVALKELLGHVPTHARKWLHDVRGVTSRQFSSEFDESEIEGRTGQTIKDGDSLLDEPVMLRHLFKNVSKQYPSGLHVLVAGKYMVFRRELRQGIIPIAHFKCLGEVEDNLGLSVVDLLKDPQELLDFVNGQILRYLQSLKRRWFVPMHSGVQDRDLLNPTRSVIRYNSNAGEPKPEVQSEIPNSLNEWVDRFDEQFDDQSGIHDIMRGKHVPGVSSGRHAEALRAGDETILGLTRTQMVEGLEQAGQVILQFVKNEWRTERRVRYLGDQRLYVDKAFRASDIGETSQVRLKKSTLLMLTPAQKLETLFGYAEMGVVDADELRRAGPIADTTGIELSEDQHVKRARRQNQAFLDGPPRELQRAHDEFINAADDVQDQLDFLERAVDLGRITEQEAQMSAQRIAEEMQDLQQEWMEELNKFAPSHREWEDDMEIARLHATEHLKVLATDKARRKPEWWVAPFEAHARLEWELANPDQVQMQQQMEMAEAQAEQAQGGPPTASDRGQPSAGGGQGGGGGGQRPPTSPGGMTPRGFPTAPAPPGSEEANAA